LVAETRTALDPDTINEGFERPLIDQYVRRTPSRAIRDSDRHRGETLPGTTAERAAASGADQKGDRGDRLPGGVAAEPDIYPYMTRELRRTSVSFQLSTSSGVPAYLQVVQQVERALRMGVLRPGDRLPTVKEVVADVAINPNTVLKAYRELESRGLVEGRQGVGTFVLRRPAGPPPEVQARLARTLERWVKSAREQGLDEASIQALLRSAAQEVVQSEVA
jgi:GntR family transcriptional regulator